MTANKSSILPSYRCHKASGQGYVHLNGRRIYLGKFDQSETRQKYLQLVAEWEANGRRLSVDPNDITVVELIARFWEHARAYYRKPDGMPSSTISKYEMTLGILKNSYGTTKAVDFGSVRLKLIRQKMIERGWCRRTEGRCTRALQLQGRRIQSRDLGQPSTASQEKVNAQ